LTWRHSADIIIERGFCKEVNLPLYEYECTQCGKHIEKIQKFSDSPLTKCEKCGGKLERLISSPAIQFKGTGWYVTDYARKSSSLPSSSSTGSGNGDKGPRSEGAKKEESKKSEDKPAGKES
jgi:putative FmdB family regulatory protein